MTPRAHNADDREIVVRLTTGTIVKVLFVLLVIFLLYTLRELALVILVSVVIASALEPAARRMCAYKIPRTIAVLLVYVLVFGIFIGGITAFLPPLLADLQSAFLLLPQYVGTFDEWNVFERVGLRSPELESAMAPADLQTALDVLSENTVKFLFTLFGGVFSFILIVVLSFYLAVQKDGIANFLRLVTPFRYEPYILDLWRRSQVKIGLWMQGQLLLTVLISVLVYLGLTILGVPYALLLAFGAGLLELIPLFGPILAAIPAVALAFMHGISFIDPGLGSAVAIVLFYVLIQQFENHLIYPFVVSKVVGVPPILVIVALVVGWQLAGFLGIILAVPLSAILVELVRDLERGKKTVAPQTSPHAQ